MPSASPATCWAGTPRPLGHRGKLLGTCTGAFPHPAGNIRLRRSSKSELQRRSTRGVLLASREFLQLQQLLGCSEEGKPQWCRKVGYHGS